MIAIKKNMITAVFFVVFSLSAAYCQEKLPVDYVDNRIGALDNESNCVIGPQMPFGSINPSPQTKNGEDDGYSPNEPIRGFGQLHVSGTGWGTNGQIFISPQTGVAVGETEHDSPKSGEQAFPYEYSVTLDRYHIGAKFTPSYHSVLYQFTFRASDSSNILLDITHNIPMDIKTVIGGSVIDANVMIDEKDNRIISGSGIYSGGFGGGAYPIYFFAMLNKKPLQISTWLNGVVSTGSNTRQQAEKNDRVGAIFHYRTKDREIIYLKIAVSYKSIEQARQWLDAEIPGWDYENLRLQARSAWNDALKKIEVSGGTEKAKTIFYTALYHAQLMPRNRTNDTKTFGKDIPFWDDHFAVWDTWRTVFPLHALINPAMVSSTVNSFIARFEKYGVVRDAFVNGNDMRSEQGGNNIDNIIAEAYLKGINGINWDKAYKVLKFDADNERLGSFMWRKQDSANNTYMQKGWIPAGIMSCSMTQEYAYNDYCIAEVAKGMGRKVDYKKYLWRSGQWVNLWNKNAESDGFKGFIMPRLRNGEFVSIDIKKYPGSWKNDFYEGTTWTYSWFAPHAFIKLVELNGGKEKFAAKLEYGFENNLIDYSNEPAFLAVQGFHYAGRDDLSSYWVRKLMRERFTEKGVPGNDDSGAMSAWYIFSAMGFFPNAGQNIYYLTGPLFNKVILHLGNGKELVITAPKASETNIYMKHVLLNGKRITSAIISYDDIKNGATIDFDMTNISLSTIKN